MAIKEGLCVGQPSFVVRPGTVKQIVFHRRRPLSSYAPDTVNQCTKETEKTAYHRVIAKAESGFQYSRVPIVANFDHGHLD